MEKAQGHASPRFALTINDDYVILAVCHRIYHGVTEQMTMHLAHPALTLGGKRKGKRKFRNADEARKARELAESWEALQKKYLPTVTVKKKSMGQPWTATPSVHIRDTGPKPPSLPDTVLGAVNSKPAQRYTGTKVLGIATMHKSNAVPVFANEDAIEISKMRRG